MKIEINGKFRASRSLRFEDTKRIMSPEMRPKSFATFEKRVPWCPVYQSIFTYYNCLSLIPNGRYGAKEHGLFHLLTGNCLTKAQRWWPWIEEAYNDALSSTCSTTENKTKRWHLEQIKPRKIRLITNNKRGFSLCLAKNSAPYAKKTEKRTQKSYFYHAEVVRYTESLDEILKCDHSNESYRAVLLRTVYHTLQGGSNFSVWVKHPWCVVHISLAQWFSNNY